MDCIIDLKQVVGIIMVFSVPLSLIIGLVYYLVDMKRNAFRLRSEIISGGVDCDTARLLLEETGRRHSLSFATLRLGLLLFFTGIAAVLARMADFTILTLWLTAAIGGGVGLLIAFVIEWKMVEKKYASLRAITVTSISPGQQAVVRDFSISFVAALASSAPALVSLAPALASV